MIDFSKVSPRLFVGTCPRTEVDVNQLKLMGVTGIFNLQTDEDFVKWKVDFTTLQQTCNEVDLVIQRLPIIDFDDEDLSLHLLKAVNTLSRMIAVGHTIYLHCTAGQERSPTVAAGYLIKYQQMDADQAESHLKSLRECAPKMNVIKAVIS